MRSNAEKEYHTDPAELLAEGQEIVRTTGDAKYRHKVEIVNLVLGGQIPSQLSQYVKESKDTITRWVKIADEQGFAATTSPKACWAAASVKCSAAEHYKIRVGGR